MENLSLTGKVAIITGSGSGIGRSTAILFVRRGAKVTLNGRDEAKLQDVAKECKKVGAPGSKVLVVAGDITKEACRTALVEKTVKEFGQLDILVNNAGQIAGEPLRDITEAGLDAMMNVMFKAPIFLTKAALKYLIKTKGCVVNLSTTITTENLPGFFSYTVAKHAIDKFTEYAALEFREAGIRVNSVKPGITETNLFDDLFNDDAKKVKGFLDHQKGHSMQKRCANPEDIAEMTAFLSSKAASHITAHHYIVDGGRAKYFHHGLSHPVASLDDLKK